MNTTFFFETKTLSKPKHQPNLNTTIRFKIQTLTNHSIQNPKHEGATHDHLFDLSHHLIEDFQRQCEGLVSGHSYPRDWICVSPTLPLSHPISEVDLVTGMIVLVLCSAFYFSFDNHSLIHPY